MTTKPQTERELRIVQLIVRRKALQEQLYNAQVAYDQCDEELQRSVQFWDEMEPLSVPDGTGESWILEPSGNQLLANHTSRMRLIDEDDSESNPASNFQ